MEDGDGCCLWPAMAAVSFSFTELIWFSVFLGSTAAFGDGNMPEFVHPKISSPGACEFPTLATAPSGFKELPSCLTNAEQKLTANSTPHGHSLIDHNGLSILIDS